MTCTGVCLARRCSEFREVDADFSYRKNFRVATRHLRGRLPPQLTAARSIDVESAHLMHHVLGKSERRIWI